MNIKISYDNKFVELMDKLKEKYPHNFFDLEGIGFQLDSNEFSRKLYASNVTADNSIDANANVSEFTPATYINEMPKPFIKMNSFYLLWKTLRLLYNSQIADDIIERQINGDIYINDFHGIASGQSYCFNFSTKDVMYKGLPFINKVRCVPPKYLYSFKSQLEQFISYASNSILGASGIADVLVIMSWYVDKILKTKSDAGFHFASEEDCWKYVKENIISFIYTVNQPFRSGLQSAFTNISLYDKDFLLDIGNSTKFPDKSRINIDTVNKLQRLYVRIMNEEMARTPITFPITTACFAVDKAKNIKDKEFLEFISKENLDYGFINIYCGDSSTLSGCCRLRSKTNNPYFNSFGTGKTKIGSLGVCSINMPRIAFKYKNKDEELKEELINLIEVSARVNNAKKHLLKRRILKGFLPLYSLGFMDLDKQYSTLGLNGLSEFLEIQGKHIKDKESQDYLDEILQLISKEVDKFQTKFDSPHNIEQIPAENVAVKLAEKDKLMGFNKDYEIYSNQFIPLNINSDILDRINIQGRFDSLLSGGGICHLNIEQKVTDYKKIMKLIEYSASKGVIYFAINYNLQQCEKEHFTIGTKDKCSICGSKITDNFTRVVGFLTNTKNWNPVRREKDYKNRHFYKDI